MRASHLNKALVAQVNSADSFMSKESGKFNEWHHILYDYFSSEKNSDDLDTDQSNIHQLLSEFLSIIQKGSKVREPFSLPQLALTLVGDAVVVDSEKLKLSITFWIYMNRFYLESSFNYPEHMGKVDDEFWFNLCSLSKLGRVEFQENICPDTELSRKLEKKHRVMKSSVLATIQNYIICTDNDCINDGSLGISWGINTDLGELLYKASFAFACLYKMNYQLYRHNYILEKSRNKRN